MSARDREQDGDRDALVRATVRYEGMVQGVGFRFTTASIARGDEVTGYVMNKADGSVEVVAEGRRSAVSGFLRAVGSSHLGRYVSKREINWSPAGREHAGFSIEHGW